MTICSMALKVVTLHSQLHPARHHGHHSTRSIGDRYFLCHLKPSRLAGWLAGWLAHVTADSGQLLASLMLHHPLIVVNIFSKRISRRRADTRTSGAFWQRSGCGPNFAAIVHYTVGNLLHQFAGTIPTNVAAGQMQQPSQSPCFRLHLRHIVMMKTTAAYCHACSWFPFYQVSIAFPAVWPSIEVRWQRSRTCVSV